ncbi:Golgin subfamily A member 7/ERF4 family-domain-containing protein [Leucosporidium creatinivorum]|uniref:Ras modification protein ERF4 n=1 Tax=Leucosporidium creatinivorum TaxID=106004 RepID=A0A1Y2G2I3_9BASI|nr:Golgin subfamily A member 7/ERF4 family-domain-containing protein [Leucosporidium creatinivorum]
MAEAAVAGSSTAHSSPLTNSNSAGSTPRTVDSSSFASPSPSGSPRVQSIRRKPAPSLKDDGGASAAGGQSGEGQETLASVDRDAGAGGGLGRKSSVGSSTGVPASPSSTYSAHLHSFPPQPHSTGGASSPAPPAVSSSSTSNPAYYTSTHTPGSMSAAARSPLPSTSRDHVDSAAFHPGLSSRPSIHSRKSSVAPESVYGTAQVGVIGKHKPREVIRVERDYSGGELCQFWSGWIWELEGRISPTDFQNTLNELNTVLASAHDPYKSCFDNCFAILTLYISPQILGSHYEREMAKFDRIMERANREVYNPAGLNLLSPRRNAFLFLEIEYY